MVWYSCGQFSSKWISFWCAMLEKFSNVCLNSGKTSTCSIYNFILLFCIFLKSSIWLISFNIRSVFRLAVIIFSCPSWLKDSLLITSSIGLAIRVSGVRSSCEISVKKRNLRLVSCCSKSTFLLKFRVYTRIPDTINMVTSIRKA